LKKREEKEKGIDRKEGKEGEELEKRITSYLLKLLHHNM